MQTALLITLPPQQPSSATLIHLDFYLRKKKKKTHSEKVKLTLLTQILHYIPDVRDEVVEPVALSGGRQVRFAVASHIHSHHTELALKLPQLVPPREPDEETRVSHTPHGERTSLIA